MDSRSRTPLDDLVPGWTAPHQPGGSYCDHLCLLYEAEEERDTVVASFLRQSIQQGRQVVYLAETRAPEEVRRYLPNEGEDWTAWLAGGQLRIAAVADTFLRQGIFDPDQIIAFLRAETERALAQGYAGLCVTSEMAGALHGSPGSDRLIDYEVQLNAFLPGSRCLVLCQYDRRRFAPELLLQVLSTHPLAVV